MHLSSPDHTIKSRKDTYPFLSSTWGTIRYKVQVTGSFPFGMEWNGEMFVAARPSTVQSRAVIFPPRFQHLMLVSMKTVIGHLQTSPENLGNETGDGVEIKVLKRLLLRKFFNTHFIDPKIYCPFF